MAAATDDYASLGPAGPVLHVCRNWATVTTSDTVDLPNVSQYIYVGGTGDITLTPAAGGSDVVFKAVPVGTLLPVASTRIKSAGTTATLLLIGW